MIIQNKKFTKDEMVAAIAELRRAHDMIVTVHKKYFIENYLGMLGEVGSLIKELKVAIGDLYVQEKL